MTGAGWRRRPGVVSRGVWHPPINCMRAGEMDKHCVVTAPSKPQPPQPPHSVAILAQVADNHPIFGGLGGVQLATCSRHTVHSVVSGSLVFVIMLRAVVLFVPQLQHLCVGACGAPNSKCQGSFSCLLCGTMR